MQDLWQAIDEGKITSAGSPADTTEAPWGPHPKFDGVWLRTIIAGAGTDGRFSVHHVRVDPGREIGEHAHHDQTELHQVLLGDGYCELEGRALDYQPGAIAVMPADEIHRVVAGSHGLVLQVVFCPPLG